MPGLIDSHVHLNFYKDGTVIDIESATWEEIGARATVIAKEMLEMGFTTVRDVGGAREGRKTVIDAGLLVGPRIYCEDGFISQASGHGDFGLPTARKGDANFERLEMARMVDGRDEVLEASRRNVKDGKIYKHTLN